MAEEELEGVAKEKGICLPSLACYHCARSVKKSGGHGRMMDASDGDFPAVLALVCLYSCSSFGKWEAT